MHKSHKAIKALKDITATLAAGDTKRASADDTNTPSWVNQVAMLTGALAALAGFLTVRTTTLTNEAIYESNQAILSQTQASDAWSEYEADSIKANIFETQLLPSSPFSRQDKAKLKEMDDTLRTRQPILKQTAEDKIKDRETHLGQGLKRLGEKDVLGYAGMAAQLGIALASVAALTRQRAIFYIGAAAGGAAVIVTAYVFISAYIAS